MQRQVDLNIRPTDVDITHAAVLFRGIKTELRVPYPLTRYSR